MNSNTVFNFSMGQDIQTQPCVHSDDTIQKTMTPQKEGASSAHKPDISEAQKTTPVMNNKEPEKTISQASTQHTPVSHLTQEAYMTQETEDDIPLIHQVFDRDKAKNFTEYVLSRPTTFAHKCEDVMATCSVLAIMAGIGAIGTIYHSDIIPSHNQIALGFVCATGICLLGTVLSGVAGGISDCWQERKNRLMQEKMEHTRD